MFYETRMHIWIPVVQKALNAAGVPELVLLFHHQLLTAKLEYNLVAPPTDLAGLIYTSSTNFSYLRVPLGSSGDKPKTYRGVSKYVVADLAP